LKSQDVYTFTLNTLDSLPLERPGALESRALLRVLVFAAAARLSIHQACEQLACAPSGPTVLGTLSRQRSDLDALAGHVKALLARLMPKGLGKRGRRVAMDLVARPDHGTVDAAHPDEVCRSQAQGGTTHFFPYATASAVGRGRRDTLAMCRVRAKQTMDHGLRTLLARLVTLVQSGEKKNPFCVRPSWHIMTPYAQTTLPEEERRRRCLAPSRLPCHCQRRSAKRFTR
jgi:hypothetical protein